MKKVIITKKDGKKGILTMAEDGRWDVAIDGQEAPKSIHYTTDQVERIIARSTEAGDRVDVY